MDQFPEQAFYMVGGRIDVERRAGEIASRGGGGLMPKPFRVDIVSPDGLAWSGDAEFVVARTPDGEIGIMADHEPVMASLVQGTVSSTPSAVAGCRWTSRAASSRCWPTR